MKNNPIEVLSIIPARSGSKGLPNKNILPLLGHPLIAYSIKASLQSNMITRTIVSTDSKNIADISKKYGAEIPFMRPSTIAEDMSTDFEVFDHALSWLKDNDNYKPDFIVQLRPTSPVRKVKIIDSCIKSFISSNADSLRVITPSPITPYKMWVVKDNEMIKPLLNINGVIEPYNQPRQLLPQTYWQVGFIDVIRIATILEKRSMSGNQIMPYIIKNEFAVDIDDMKSFGYAGDIIDNCDYVKF